jgi:hypothetical protein
MFGANFFQQIQCGGHGVSGGGKQVANSRPSPRKTL